MSQGVCCELNNAENGALVSLVLDLKCWAQDKKGNIILPAEDDSMLSDSEESVMAILGTRVLSKHPGSIRITVSVHLCKQINLSKLTEDHVFILFVA